MTENEQAKFALYNKVAWAIYTLATIIMIVILVTMVATDNEEKVFYSLMTAAVAYVFRPTEKFFRSRILRIMKLPEDAIDDTPEEKSE